MDLPLFRHLLASISYRLHAAVRGAPPEFADSELCPGSRTPLGLLRHCSHLMLIVQSAHDPAIEPIEPKKVEWNAELERFDTLCVQIDCVWERGDVEWTRWTPEQILQGPLADALTHVGQIALMRRLAGDPVARQSYLRASVIAGRLGEFEPPQPSPSRLCPPLPTTSPQNRLQSRRPESGA